jgi:amidase
MPVIRAKFWGEDQSTAFKNWEEVTDLRNRADGRQGVNVRIILLRLLRRAVIMVVLEDKLDALVRLHTPWPSGLIGHPHQYDIPHNLTP